MKERKYKITYNDSRKDNPGKQRMVEVNKPSGTMILTRAV